MSAIPVLDLQLRSPIRERPLRDLRRLPRPIEAPVPQTRTLERTHTRVVTRPGILTIALAQCAAFATIAGSVYGVAGLAGQVALEHARQDGIHAVARAEVARKMELQLRARLEQLESPDQIQTWALGHGFAPLKG
jgi:ABC-type branched-subunit amino acid transport system permease subunit